MNLNELVAVVANFEERGVLEKLDEIGLPPGNVVQWLFGLTSGFYFADGETRRTRQVNCTPFRPDSRHKQKGSSTGLMTGLCLTSIDTLNC